MDNLTRSNILQGISAIEHFNRDLRSLSEREWNKLKIKGSIKINLLKANPYISYTRIKRTKGQEDLLYIGFLLRKLSGMQGPSLLIQGEHEVLEKFAEHLVHLEKDTLFYWGSDKGQLDFKEAYLKSGAYDVFLCHNNFDKPKVRDICRRLKEEGFLPWFDENSIPAGSIWKKEIQDGLKNVTCAAVFFGPRGLGPWQQMEVYGVLNRAAREGMTVIPIILDGFEEDVEIDDFMREFQLIDLRKSKEKGFKALCDRIREASTA